MYVLFPRNLSKPGQARRSDACLAYRPAGIFLPSGMRDRTRAPDDYSAVPARIDPARSRGTSLDGSYSKEMESVPATLMVSLKPRRRAHRVSYPRSSFHRTKVRAGTMTASRRRFLKSLGIWLTIVVGPAWGMGAARQRRTPTTPQVGDGLVLVRGWVLKKTDL